jgi:hypothetical protein
LIITAEYAEMAEEIRVEHSQQQPFVEYVWPAYTEVLKRPKGFLGGLGVLGGDSFRR